MHLPQQDQLTSGWYCVICKPIIAQIYIPGNQCIYRIRISSLLAEFLSPANLSGYINYAITPLVLRLSRKELKCDDNAIAQNLCSRKTNHLYQLNQLVSGWICIRLPYLTYTRTVYNNRRFVGPFLFTSAWLNLYLHLDISLIPLNYLFSPQVN